MVRPHITGPLAAAADMGPRLRDAREVETAYDDEPPAEVYDLRENDDDTFEIAIDD